MKKKAFRKNERNSFFNESNESNITQQKEYIPKLSNKEAKETIRRDNKKLNKEIALGMKILFCFTDRVLNNANDVTLDSHHINHTESKTIKKSNLLESGNIHGNKTTKRKCTI